MVDKLMSRRSCCMLDMKTHFATSSQFRLSCPPDLLSDCGLLRTNENPSFQSSASNSESFPRRIFKHDTVFHLHLSRSSAF